MTAVMGLYFFAIAFVLAHLEIQIEGAHGWAEKLPTWRWQTPRVLRWVGKPVTGYHVFLLLFILLLLHLPMMYVGFSLEREVEIVSLFCLLAVFWDFLWFVCNPHFGLARFSVGHVWWFKSWTLRLPTCYLMGLGLSLLIYATTGPLVGGPAWGQRASSWGMVFSAFLVPTLVVVAATSRSLRRTGPSAEIARLTTQR
jgi:hypothetical protein